mmetsp:Transcript_48611/g.113842  ORF Transcript_48611/g.113842 Transcript_48611/m.113842 type:complete len:787 (-) Transcript_48611:45-2405(-)
MQVMCWPGLAMLVKTSISYALDMWTLSQMTHVPTCKSQQKQLLQAQQWRSVSRGSRLFLRDLYRPLQHRQGALRKARKTATLTDERQTKQILTNMAELDVNSHVRGVWRRTKSSCEELMKGRKLSMAEDGLKIVDLVDKFASRLSLGQPLPHPGCIGVGDKLADKEEVPLVVPVTPRFKVGDRVLRRASGEGAAGVVAQVLDDGVVEVRFSDGALTMESQMFRPTPAVQTTDAGEDVLTTLGPGDSFGEMSVIYNTRREATFRVRDAAEIYRISRKHLRKLYTSKDRGARVREYCALLDEVSTLTPMLISERWELACNAGGYVCFRPNEQILHQGKKREARQWYVIASGSCVVTRMENNAEQKLVELRRGGHFGERSLLRGTGITEVSISAGAEGAMCLTFDWEVAKVLLEETFRCGMESAGLNVDDDIRKWIRMKGSHDNRRNLPVCDAELNKLRCVSTLGQGGFATVFLVEDPAGERYALKRISKGHAKAQKVECHVRWERDLLSMVDSPFVVGLRKTFKDRENVYLLLDACLGGSLLSVLQRLPEVFLEDAPRGTSTAFYVSCIIAGLEHLHDRRIVYRDLKPENVLLDATGYAKLCDMGFARFCLGKAHTLGGTPDYLAPEMIDVPHTHDHSVDWWSLGCLTFELATGQTPFEDEGIADPHGRLLAIRRSQERGPAHFPFHCPRSMKAFINALLQRLPHRLGASGGAVEVRQHAWFADLGFDFDLLQRKEVTPPYMPACYEADDPPAVQNISRGPDMWVNEVHEEVFVPYEDCDGCRWYDNF